MTLIGDSAGGNLAAAVSLKLRDRGRTLPGAQIQFSRTFAENSSLSLLYWNSEFTPSRVLNA